MTESLQSQYVALQEFVTAARQQLGNNEWGYIVGGTETETSQRRNRLAIEKLALRPRVLNDVSEVDCSCDLFGKPATLPVLLCPIGGLESFDPEGAVSVARGAGAGGVPMMLSSVSRRSIEEVSSTLEQSAAENDRKGDKSSVILQLYAREDAAGIDATVERCMANNATAFCITVDSAVYSRRERDIVARYQKPWRAVGEGDAAHYQAALSWKDIERIRKLFPGQLILKGIATAEDAKIAIETGVDCIYVSNHGGRQLDHTLGTLDMLQQIAPLVKQHNGAGGNSSGKDSQRNVTLLVDGGFCRGTDIVKALALGAEAVGLGRMMCLALAASGSDGIVRMLELLQIELRATLALLGVTSLADINDTHIQSCEALAFEHSLSAAFPLLQGFSYD